MLNIITKNETLVVDSRLIAQELGIEHRALMQTIKKYLDRLERKSPVTFEMEVVKRPQGGTYEVTYCYLNESQANLLMTFSRNTEQVLDCKEKLVYSFEKAKEVIKTIIPQQSEEIESLRLQNEILDKQLKLRELDNTMLLLHGKQVTLALRGYDQAIVEVEKPTLEVIDKRSGDRREGMTTKQLNEYLQQQTGNSFKSGSQVKQILEKEAPELLDIVQRPINQDWVLKENVEKAIEVLKRRQPKQMLLGE